MFMLKKMGGYLIGAVLGLSAGAILYFVQPVKWKGQALVRVGHLNKSYSIEPLGDAIERIKSRSFIQTVAERAKRDEIVALLNVEEDAGLTVRQTKSGESLIITVVGGSAELVQASIDSIISELVSRHEAITSNYLSDIRKELSRLELERDVLSKRLATMVNGQAVASLKQAEERRLVTGFGVMAIQHDLEYKLNRSSNIRELISSANIRPTSLMEPVSISERRIFSSLWRACLFGVLLGTFLSVLWVRWVIGSKRNQNRPEQKF